MVKILKTENDNVIAIVFNDETLKYEINTVNSWVTYLDDGPEFIIDGIVMKPDDIWVDDIENLRNELKSADDFIHYDVDFTFRSSNSVKKYPVNKINSLINWCQSQNIWVGWSVHSICININRPFDEQDAGDICGYSNRKISELIEFIQANDSSIDTSAYVWTLKDEHSKVTINRDICRVTAEVTLYGHTFEINIDPGFRGLMMNRIFIPINDIKSKGLSELVLFKNSIPLKALEIILEQNFAYDAKRDYDDCEFSFNSKKSFDIDAIKNDLGL